jgi:peptidoglycan/LPS O-acetylase OafA/YrhL
MTCIVNKNEGSNRIPGLDGIRAIAILMVLCAHFISGSNSNWLIKLLAKNGGFGVEIFFVLSGFLITILILREEEKNDGFSIRIFYLRRALRILPPLTIFLVFLSLLNFVGGIKITGLDISACLFFLRNYFGQSQETEHIWTLSIEEQYYLLFPILITLIKSNRIRLTFLVVMVLLLSPWKQYCYSFPEMNWRRTDLRFEPLIIGSAFAISRQAVFPKVLTNQFFSSAWAVFLSLFVIAASFAASKSNLVGIQSLRTTATYVSIGLIVNAVSSGKVWLVSPILATNPIIWLGQISYSLYIWQQLFSPFDNRTNLSWYTFSPQNIFLAFIFGAVSFYLIENPANAFKAKLFGSKSRTGQ